jgi:GNAT superfamily N-acetyltransferase
MVPADLAAVAALEVASHAPLPPEGVAPFASRLALFPAGCLAVGDKLAGYAVAHPWAGPAPRLGTRLGALPAAADHLLIHDVALAPAARGQGLVAAAVARFAGLGFAELRLVAVHGTAPVWARHGFVAGDAVAGYGVGAVLMRRAG